MTQANMGSGAAATEYKSQPVLLLGKIKNENQGEIERFALEKFRLTIGRSEDDDIRLPDGSGVSRNHASVFVLDGEVVIEDLGSRNGTFVNRKLLRGSRQTTLKFGDVIIIGRYSLKLIDESVAYEPDDTPQIHDLLRTWNAAAVVPDAGTCALCNAATDSVQDIDDVTHASETTVICTAEEGAQGEPTEEMETLTDEGASAEVSRPGSGRSYGRKLHRRQKQARRRGPVRQVTMRPLKRSLQLTSSRTPSAATALANH